MAKWKLFGKSKPREEDIIETEKTTEETIEEPIDETEEIIETENEIDNEPLAEYHETLEEGIATTKQKSSPMKTDQRVYRNVYNIECDVDNLHITKAQKPVAEIDKKVDKIITNVKLKKDEKTRKPSNVIYVISSPQPGEVRGDWAVRSHGKFFSHHKTKEKAIEEARKIAKKREATVMVQNTDGTFSEGFKPR